MLQNSDLSVSLSKKAYKKECDNLELELINLQREILAKGVPVIIAFEGLSTAGKGMLINELCIPLDPRGYRVFDGRQNDKELTELIPFWVNSPEKGFISIFDRSWYRTAFEESFRHGEVNQTLVDYAKNFAQHHINSDTLIIKFFVHISKETQSKRLQKLCSNKDTEWRVNRSDLFKNVHYDKYVEAASKVLTDTNAPAPWTVVEADDEYHARFKVLKTVVYEFQKVLKKPIRTSCVSIKLTNIHYQKEFDDLDLSQSLEKSEYKKEFKKYGEELRTLGRHKIFKQDIPVVLVFEGWDAAGKGGAIRRLSRFFDPRSFRVCPIAAPTDLEKGHNYLWRFCKELPQNREILVFDRSWYGRVLVDG